MSGGTAYGVNGNETKSSAHRKGLRPGRSRNGAHWSIATSAAGVVGAVLTCPAAPVAFARSCRRRRFSSMSTRAWPGHGRTCLPLLRHSYGASGYGLGSVRHWAGPCLTLRASAAEAGPSCGPGNQPPPCAPFSGLRFRFIRGRGFPTFAPWAALGAALAGRVLRQSVHLKAVSGEARFSPRPTPPSLLLDVRRRVTGPSPRRVRHAANTAPRILIVERLEF